MPTNSIIEQFTNALETTSEWLGRSSAWLVLIMALVTGAVVVIRYVFGSGSIALQESTSYLHSAIFMLGACYTLKHGEHVRVDVFYQGFSDKTKAWVDAVGAIVFVLPLCLFIIFTSLNYVENAWHIKEGSPDPGGIHGVYLLKTLIPILGLTLLMQALAEIFRNGAKLVRFYGQQQC